MNYTYNLLHVADAAKYVLEHISEKTILFYGDLGVGKTTLIKELAKQLGFLDMVNSPTYSLVNQYSNEKDKLNHFDFYRIIHSDEAMDIGFEDYLFENSWNFIEWPERIIDILPSSNNKLFIHQNIDGTRTLKIKTNSIK